MAARVDADLALDDLREEAVGAGEAAPGVGDVGVDLGLVAAEPVERGPGRPEGPVVRGEAERVDEAAWTVPAAQPGLGAGRLSGGHPGAPHARRRTGQDEAGQLLRPVHRVLAGEDRAHRVPQEELRGARVAAHGQLVDRVEVLGDDRPAVAGPDAGPFEVAGGAAVAPVVAGVDGPAGRGEGAGEAVVALGVLGHAVADLEDGQRLTDGEPGTHQETLAVGTVEASDLDAGFGGAVLLRCDVHHPSIRPALRVRGTFGAVTPRGGATARGPRPRRGGRSRARRPRGRRAGRRWPRGRPGRRSPALRGPRAAGSR